jgi:MFS transporter, DHA3 family, macrolide efflux protein
LASANSGNNYRIKFLTLNKVRRTSFTRNNKMTTSTQPTTTSMTTFFVLWAGQAVSLVGSQLVQFGLIWWLTEQTGSAVVLAMASLVGLVPQVVLGPLIGALIDRWNRKLILLLADGVVALSTAVLAILFYTNNSEIWHIFLVLFIRALGGAFHAPTMMATTSLMVPPQHLTRIQGLNQTLQGGLNIISAPLAAFLLVAVGFLGILLIDVFTALFAIVPLLFIAIPQPRTAVNPNDPSTSSSSSSIGHEIMEGFRYVWQQRGLFILISMAALLNFLIMPGITLLPLLVSQHFQGDAFQFATMQTAFGIGVLLGGILLGVWGGFQRRILTTFSGLIGLGIGLSMVGLAPAGLFWLAVAGMFVAGLMIPLTNGPLHAIFQTVVAPEFHGRVFTLLGTISIAMAPLGLIIAGPIADTLGVRFWLITGGILCIIIGATSFFNPYINDIENSTPTQPTPPEAHTPTPLVTPLPEKS